MLKNQLCDLKDGFIILEYELPRRFRRPDVIVLYQNIVFVIEFKIGSRQHDSTAIWQVQSYALDLRDFHAACENRIIVPILCATGIDEGPCCNLSFNKSISSGVTEVILAGAKNLGYLITQIIKNIEDTSNSIDYASWIKAAYKPSPTIIEAAVQLYQGHGVREISHRYAHNLDKTVNMLVSEIERASYEGKHVICFITGIPGSGKTLTGLEVIHDPDLRKDKVAAGVFLSGNGPLVKIVREALVMHQVARGRSRRECQREVTTFIQNVHQFLRYYREHPNEPPHEHVVVFDEAQRAWNQEQMKRKHGVDKTEAEELLEVMERLTDWAVIIALVGGGQEIYLGESGLEAWGKALEKHIDKWEVVASREALVGGASVAGHRLFPESVPERVRLREEPLAHLSVGVRSHRARRWADWVNKFLSLRLDEAKEVVPDSREFPCFITRDLEKARKWLREMWLQEPSYRIGLVATSEDQRLRAYGIEVSSSFRTSYPYEKWFLAPPSDVRSSYFLEVAATEFECQGLELDWVGVCWGSDLTPDNQLANWIYRKFRGSRWLHVRSEIERAYITNRYRVLLTRARKGMVIWVPPGSKDDPTRDPKQLDHVYKALKAAGLSEL